MYYSEQYINAARELKDTLWIAYGNYLKGNIYCELGEFDLALENMMTAIQYFQKLDDTINVASLYNDIGYSLTFGSSQVEGLKYFLLSLELSEKINDTSLIADVSTNLAYFYSST